MKYTVEWLQDDIYQVIGTTGNKQVIEPLDDEGMPKSEIVYQGSLADCEAYIRLKEGGYM